MSDNVTPEPQLNMQVELADTRLRITAVHYAPELPVMVSAVVTAPAGYEPKRVLFPWDMLVRLGWRVVV